MERHRLELVARERSGHTAVVEDNLLYVWGGYMVSKTNTRPTNMFSSQGVCVWQGNPYSSHNNALLMSFNQLTGLIFS